jgi:hypothetical protein
VPREVLKWVLMRKEIPKIYMNLIQDMYEGSRASVKNLYRVKEVFKVEVSVH